MKTAIILLNWNGADDTIDCLESLVQAKGGFFAVVVDNDSHDDSMERLKAWQSAPHPCLPYSQQQWHGSPPSPSARSYPGSTVLCHQSYGANVSGTTAVVYGRPQGV